MGTHRGVEAGGGVSSFHVLGSANPTIWWLTIPRKNFYRPLLAQICHGCAFIEAWLSSHSV